MWWDEDSAWKKRDKVQDRKDNKLTMISHCDEVQGWVVRSGGLCAWWAGGSVQ